MIGIDRFGESAPAKDLYAHFGITAERIAQQVRRLVRQQRRSARWSRTSNSCLRSERSPSPALVLFDLDGTLVATAPELQDAVNDTLREFALGSVSLAQVETWIGHGTRELLAQALAFASGIDLAAVRASENLDAITSEFDGHYQRRCGTRSHLYPHVPEASTELRRRGVKLAVVTNKESRFTDAVLRRHALLPLLDRLSAAIPSLPASPIPPGSSCASVLGVPARRTLIVGDWRVDVTVARNAGIAIWAVTYGYNMGYPIACGAPDRLLPSLSPLLGPLELAMS